jgi:hypothetical protein
MALRLRDTKAMIEALYVESNRVYFNGKLPAEAKIVLRKMPKADGKYVKKKQVIVLNKNLVLVDGDTLTIKNVKISKLAKALREQMALYAVDLEGKKPIRSAKHKKAVEKMDTLHIE